MNVSIIEVYHQVISMAWIIGLVIRSIHFGR